MAIVQPRAVVIGIDIPVGAIVANPKQCLNIETDCGSLSRKMFC
jgi:hypothetical protein